MMKAIVCPMAVPTHTRAQPSGTPKMAPPAIAKSAPGNITVTAAMSASCAITSFSPEVLSASGALANSAISKSSQGAKFWNTHVHESADPVMQQGSLQ